MSAGPYFTRQDDGTIVATWPDPLAREYPVSVELLREWVVTFNERVKALRLLEHVTASSRESSCSFDHHGDCQEHGWFGIEPGELCPIEEVRQFLASVGGSSLEPETDAP